jgi:hypothetical protein
MKKFYFATTLDLIRIRIRTFLRIRARQKLTDYFGFGSTLLIRGKENSALRHLGETFWSKEYSVQFSRALENFACRDIFVSTLVYSNYIISLSFTRYAKKISYSVTN